MRELVDFELGYSVDKALVSVRSMQACVRGSECSCLIPSPLQTFLFVSERRVAGCVMAERIREVSCISSAHKCMCVCVCV